MRGLILFCVLLAAVLAVPRDSLLPCLQLKLDPNSDGTVTLSELGAAIPSRYASRYSAESLMHLCDVNKDGVLTMADWNTNTSCLISPKVVNFVHKLCQ